MNHFVIIVPVWNSVKYIEKCLDSILSQDYKNYTVIVADDCSVDGTWELIKKYPFNNYQNDHHTGSGIPGMIEGIKKYSKDNKDIIVELDGDDYFAIDNVLSYLDEVYTEDIWMTYGQFIPLSGNYGPYCKLITDTRSYRKSGEWLTSHLKTFRKWLWDKIDDSDLRDIDGGYYRCGGDCAILYPMIEMAGRHVGFIDKVLYIYNDMNPNNIYVGNLELNARCVFDIINKPSYNEL